MALSTRIQIGKLRHRIQLVKPYGPAQDSSGGMALASTSPVVTLWGSVEAITANENLVSDAFVSTVSHKITIRYRGPRQAVPVTIAAQDQIYFAKRVFQVLGVMNPDERTKSLVILCVEVNDGGNQSPAISMSSGLL